MIVLGVAVSEAVDSSDVVQAASFIRRVHGIPHFAGERASLPGCWVSVIVGGFVVWAAAYSAALLAFAVVGGMVESPAFPAPG